MHVQLRADALACSAPTASPHRSAERGAIVSQQSDKISAIISLCNEIAHSVEQMEGKQVNPALLSAVFDVLMQAKVLVEDDNESESYDVS